MVNEIHSVFYYDDDDDDDDWMIDDWIIDDWMIEWLNDWMIEHDAGTDWLEVPSIFFRRMNHGISPQ